MAEVGFFTRVDLKAASSNRTPVSKRGSNLPTARLNEMGCDACPLAKSYCSHPKMRPTGSAKPLVYILGEAPTASEDEAGEQFIGVSGQLLRKHFPRTLQDRIRINNTVRCRPPKNRIPSDIERECCRGSVEDDIAATKPKLVIGLGGIPLTWVLKRGASLSAWRGRFIPINVKGHKCWFLSTFHPLHILRVKDQRGGGDKLSGEDYMWTFDRDLKTAFARVAKLTEPFVPEDDELEQGLVYPKTVTEICDFLVQMKRSPAVAIDIETTCLRPYTPSAAVLSCSISNGGVTGSFLLEHPYRKQTPQGFKYICQALKELLLSDTKKIIQNLAFELEWFLDLFGDEVLTANGWHDTMISGYALDERSYSLSLDFMIREHFGFWLKGHSAVDRKNLLQAPIDDLLRYNGLDAKWTYYLYQSHKKLLEDQGLVDYYNFHLKRIPALVRTQYFGMPVSQDKVRQLKTNLAEKIESTLDVIYQQKEVALYEKRFGEFNPGSNQQLIVLLRDLLQRQEGQKKDGKYSVDVGALSQMTDLPLAGKILELRSLEKLKSTYVDPLDLKSPEPVVWPDGKLHTSFNSTYTATGRLSSDKPNMQNFPKRTSRYVRSQIKPPAGYVLGCADYGQIEARIIAIMSKDKTLCKALWDDYDIHMDWAERIKAEVPSIMKVYGDLKKLRAAVKNKMVFPAFYGSMKESIARSLELDSTSATRLFKDFWKMFEGVKTWQEDLSKFYKTHGYVVGLTGRRRRGPLSQNMIYNTPVQGTASDVVVDAMTRLTHLSIQTGNPNIQPCLNIHDDLTFIIEKRRLEEALLCIVKEMVTVPFDWVTVPISIDVEVGPDWATTESIGKFVSTEFKESA